MGVLAIVEGPAPESQRLNAGIAERVDRIPRLRQILHTRPLDLGAPEWVEDRDFDLSHHVHRAALAGPGDDRELFRLAAHTAVKAVLFWCVAARNRGQTPSELWCRYRLAPMVPRKLHTTVCRSCCPSCQSTKKTRSSN